MKYVSEREDPGKYINEAIDKLYEIINEICPAGKEEWVESELEEIRRLIEKYNEGMKEIERRLESLKI